MASRNDRARIATEAVDISLAGQYRLPSGQEVLLGDAIQLAIHQTELITPSQISGMRDRAMQILAKRDLVTNIEVKNETTFASARRLVDQYGSAYVTALNFASAKNPGGGFLGGSQAQEESLARASALYVCLQTQDKYYQINRAHASLLYTDHMIFSPCVPVFRDDQDILIDQPWNVSIITAPAPNAGAIAKNEPESLGEIKTTFRRRIENVLVAAVIKDQKALVLGAWGCGVFGNDPATVAKLFGEFLLNDGPYSRAFKHIAFAVLDRHGSTLQAFSDVFEV